ncbi:PqiC family protein [Chromohalobacter nigrandesensis]|uniref:PqiC family protein n=1 Tax=Chromohalobacter nigrandesensis TaxID=119863 RepID=UPI001FF11362|nr:ABC-type transport auxiliary lipoprotein family protein [Chromohalobacter nigrandesensis]MCK0744868.1 PqiC family protein [Chromohalobacter nigrandesensis]
MHTRCPTRPMRLLAAAGLGLFMSLLVGCAGQGIDQSRYTLPDETQNVKVAGDFKGSVSLAAPRMASYLKDDGIVMQLDDIRIHQASNYLWAEPLDRQLQERMRQHLGQALPNADVLRRGQSGEPSTPALHVQLDVDRFQGRDDGMAVVGGQWRIRDDDDRTLSRESFEIERPLEDDGYPALVRALGAAWGTLGDRLANTLVEVGDAAKK